MIEYPDLELVLQRDSSSYRAEFRLSLPGSDADRQESAPASFDLPALRSLLYDQEAYGRSLGKQLLGDPQALAAFTSARAAAQDSPLRLRLSIDSSASELHSLWWETLRDPDVSALLFTGEGLFFSRYLSSRDWQPVRLRSRGEWKALVVVANPTNLEEYQLDPINTDGEIGLVRQVIKNVPLDVLPSNGKSASLEAVVSALRDGGYDLVYIVAHGVLVHDEPWLFLEDAQGKVSRVSGKDLAARLQELSQRPRLVVLASCQSAADSGAGVLSALGPRLIESGIPAVIAMQGNISLETNAAFMQVFFSELQKDGQIDRAVSLARGAVRDRMDFWMPVLFMRLKSGRIWYVPSFHVTGGAGEQDDFDEWESLTDFVQRGECTPILGPALVETLVVARRDIARKWAKDYGYPLSPDDYDDLPRVAQYLVTRFSPAYLQVAFNKTLRTSLEERFGIAFQPEWLNAKSWTPDILLNAIQIASDQLGEDGPNPFFNLLAQLPLPIFITTQPNDLLEGALRKAGRDPQVRLCPWNPEIVGRWRKWWQYEDIPTPESPLVYHLFGHFALPTSLVLTEDDYLDFLIGLTENKDLVPSSIRGALASNALLFLGFQVDDWNFRVFFRNLMAQEGQGQRVYSKHLAAQIEADENSIQNPLRARNFLEKYFEGGKVSVFWGSAAEFLEALARHL